MSGFPRHAASCAWPIWIQIAPCGLVERSERPVGGIQAPRPADGLSRCPRARTIERMALAASSCKANCSRATRTAPPATDAPSREPPAVPPRPRVSIVRSSTPGPPPGVLLALRREGNSPRRVCRARGLIKPCVSPSERPPAVPATPCGASRVTTMSSARPQPSQRASLGPSDLASTRLSSQGGHPQCSQPYNRRRDPGKQQGRL